MVQATNYKIPLSIDDQTYQYFSLEKVTNPEALDRLPFALKILLENLVRHLDGQVVTQQDIDALLNWDPKARPKDEIAFTPSRVILQDFTGVPAVVDLAVMRDAMADLGANPEKINPLSPVELVIDHSVMVDFAGTNNAFTKNTDLEFQRNQERYTFLRWGQSGFDNFKVVPPGTGIVHQVNLEYLAKVVYSRVINNEQLIYPDTLVGTDSHTTMINGLGVLGWGVGGIEAEAAMLGQPITMLIPQVVGLQLTGSLPEGCTATDLVLAVVEILRQEGVVGKFVEFFGQGLDHLTLADRATIANMAPEYGATCGIFPIDEETLSYLRLSGRSEHQVKLTEQYAKSQRMFRSKNSPTAQYSTLLTLDLSTIEPCIAGPKRPQDRITLKTSKQSFQQLLQSEEKEIDNNIDQLTHGSVVIAAITSCTNTSNPSVMLAAGLLAKHANQFGLSVKPWVKTSLAPGSQVVTDYLDAANLTADLETLGFNLVGYGCTTCIGNSGPLDSAISEKITAQKLGATAVLSGNRNFEGRIHPLVRYAYLASPPLVVAYALAGTMNIDLMTDPLGTSKDGKPVFLKDIWPSQQEIHQTVQKTISAELFTERYRTVFDGNEAWQKLSIPTGKQYTWDPQSTYVKKPPYFDGITTNPPGIASIENARVLALLGDSVTTDHISPAGVIAKDSPAGQYLQDNGIDPRDFNSYGSRRGNHEVMMRGTFANIRLRNQLAPGTEGGWTMNHLNNQVTSIYDASMQYQANNIPLIVLAGKEYGTGSSRDWAAKGTRLLGVKAVIAESFERIHRSNLIGMGVLPLQFKTGEGAKSLKLNGTECFSLDLNNLSPQCEVTVNVTSQQGQSSVFQALCRIDTPKELEYLQHGGILHYVLRQLI